jgi:hypothetical protein
MRDSLGGIIKDADGALLRGPGRSRVAKVTLPRIDVRFNPDGSLASEPKIVQVGPTDLDRVVAETALRAVRRCAPYRIRPMCALLRGLEVLESRVRSRCDLTRLLNPSRLTAIRSPAWKQ